MMYNYYSFEPKKKKKSSEKESESPIAYISRYAAKETLAAGTIRL